jgi:hypothetical protein
MVKITRFPTSHEVQRLRERWDMEDGDLKPFDTTLTSGIDDTVSHLRSLPYDRRASVESNQLRFDALEQLTAEARFMRKSLADIVTALNHKASKRSVKRGIDEFAAKLEKRVDNIFKLVGTIAAIFGIVIAAFKAH